MLKKYIYACLLMALTLLNYSCKKDIGNYDYHAINEVVFPTELNGKITGFVLTNLTISPKLTFTQDGAGTDQNRYTYEWAYIIPTGQTNAGLRTLATTKDLNILVNIAPGTYTSLYKVTDNITGVQFVKKFSLEIRNVYNEGWLLMTDVNGKAQFDMLSKQVDGQFVTINDLLTQTKSDLQLKGKPRLVYSYNTGKLNGYGINLSYGLYLGTDQSIDRIDPETFAWQANYNVKREILNPDLPQDFHIDALKQARGDNQAYMISSSGDVYFTAPSQQVKYSQPLNYNNGQVYRVAPFIAVNEAFVTGNPQAYFYDVEHRRFYKHLSAFDSKLIAVPDPTRSTAQLFLFSNTGNDLMYMNFVSKATEVYAMLKDPATAKVYLARFSAIDATQTDYREMVSTDVDKAENFAVSPDQGYIYYNVGGKLYQYDYTTTPTTSKLVKDYGAAKISLLKFQSYQSAVKYPDGGKLMVCSYDPSLPEGQNGKIEQYNILLGATGISLDKTYTGFGKVVSLHYRER
ncbi:PKD-like family lipoprotein [Pedobacter nutrimenti]|uniref:PKD-like family lipoprotein n=1 Tax=Pedobacter nutrimenti TaxID=1241337 RepID=UPI00293060F6|nr:PKD-like family lipoprotein [Pedobacter nutrimenti]